MAEEAAVAAVVVVAVAVAVVAVVAVAQAAGSCEASSDKAFALHWYLLTSVCTDL